jgi:hypothetical protein
MISNGYGSVVAQVFDAEGVLVFDGLTRFRYVHSEVVDDASSLTIETFDLDLVDHPALQDGKKLKVVWGYLPDNLVAHIVWIWDIVPTFTTSGLRLELQCYCKAAYMRLNSSQKVWENTTLENIAEELAESYGMTPGTEGIDADAQSKTPNDFKTVETGNKSPSVLDLSTNKVILARDNTASVLRYNFREYPEGEPLPQANKSDRRFIDDVVAQEPVDNMIVNGRDDRLLVQRRNLNQAPYKAYIFKDEPGYLLSFSPATKNSQGEKGIASVVTGFVEDEKEAIQSEVTQSQSGAGVMGEMIELTLEQVVRKKVEEENDNSLDRRVSVGGLLQEEYDGVDSEGKPQYKKVVVSKLDTTKRAFIMIKKTGTRPSTLSYGKTLFTSSGIDAIGRIETQGIVIKEPKEYLPTVETKPQNIIGTGVARQAKQQLDLYSAEATILGDPSLESSKVIHISGVGKKYSGNYYIYQVSHDITPEGGYICTCQMYRTGNNNIGSEIANKVDAETLGLNKNTTIGIPVHGTDRLARVEVKPDGPNDGAQKKPRKLIKTPGL